MLLLLFLLILHFKSFINGNNLNVGKIPNVSLNLPVWSSRSMTAPILNGTCEECLCSIMTNSSALNSLNSIGIGSFNCFIKNNTCQVFSKASFYEYWLNNDTNTTFYFIEQPTMFNNSNLVAWHSFDGGSYNDSSGNGLNAIQVVDVWSVSGRINEALQFYSNSSLYEIGGFTQLGQPNAPYSVALWARPTVLSEAPLLHLSSGSDGLGWCIDMLGFLTGGEIVSRCWQSSPVIVNGFILNPNAWVHVATTYSSSIGLQLYINGTLLNGSQPFYYAASGATNYLTLANSLLAQNSLSCNTYMIAHTGTFQGLIDELRVYARALSADDIYALANP